MSKSYRQRLQDSIVHRLEEENVRLKALAESAKAGRTRDHAAMEKAVDMAVRYAEENKTLWRTLASIANNELGGRQPDDVAREVLHAMRRKEP